MSDIAIRVEDLGKRYEIGELVSMRDLPRVAKKIATAPFRKLLGRRPPLPLGEGRGEGSTIPGNGQGDGHADASGSDASGGDTSGGDASGGRHFWALRDINFEVRHGEVLGIIGRNGAGKSTLLKVLSRITAPTTGRADVYGRVASLLEIGTGFHPDLTGRENVYLNGSILGMTRREIDSKFDEIVAFAGVDQFIDTPVKRYSSGMRVRLGFAVAAHLLTEVMIIDEVLAVGDTEFQAKCMGKMDAVAKSGRTVLFVSHNMGSIRSLCTRAMVLERGTVTEEGTAEDCVDAYLALMGTDESKAAAYTDRSGNGKVMVQTLDVLNESGQPSRSLLAGGAVTFRLEYTNRTRVEGFDVIMNIFSHAGIAVVHLGTRLMGHVIQPRSESGTITCTIPRLPLTTGRYRVAVLLSDRGERFDQVSNALAFDVVGSKFYSSGGTPPRGAGVCLVDQEWSHAQEETSHVVVDKLT